MPAIGDIRAILPRNRGAAVWGGARADRRHRGGVALRLALPALIFGVLEGIPGAGPLAFGFSALLFGTLHLYQGPLGILFATILGLLFTVLYVLSGTIVFADRDARDRRLALAGADSGRDRRRVGCGRAA